MASPDAVNARTPGTPRGVERLLEVGALERAHYECIAEPINTSEMRRPTEGHINGFLRAQKGLLSPSELGFNPIPSM